ncbi:MAG: hypothetical protein HGA35_06705 [Erysipelotrichaceae bacterium]|nr:hypothetical protein [Erysipelotrichaceae bacterium]
MSKIKKEDLELLSNDEIRELLNSKDFHFKQLPEHIRLELLDIDAVVDQNKLRRVIALLTEIVVERFLKQKPLYGFLVNCDAVNTVGELKEILNNFDDGDIVVVEDDDLFPFYVDVITGMELTTGGTREIRFTKIENEVN